MRVVEAYEHITDSIANSDRRIFTGFAVDTNLYNLSPILTVFYAYVINKTIELFNKQEAYGCFLHPGIRHNIESCLLFEKRNKSGRVIVANIPESMFEEIPEVTVNLLHEVFHIITREQRHRKDRAEIMIGIMERYIMQKVFENVGILLKILDLSVKRFDGLLEKRLS